MISCRKEDTTEAPLREAEIVNLLLDMHLSEASLSRVKNAVLDSTRQVYFQMILNKFEINKSQHDEIMEYLKKDPEYLSDLYRKVYDSLEVIEKHLDEKQLDEKQLDEN